MQLAVRLTDLHVVLVLPGTNAVSERSFSALKQIKTTMRSTIGQARLNNLLILHIYKDVEIHVDTETVVKDFRHGRIDRTKAIAIKK